MPEDHASPIYSGAWTSRSRRGLPCNRLIDRFDEDAGACSDAASLRLLIADATRELGFAFFALMHHVSPTSPVTKYLRLDTYPESWSEEFFADDLTGVDPVHHACRRTGVGFAWDQLEAITRVGARERAMLERARHHDIGNGFTVPISLPGEPLGSCTFAVRCSSDLPYERLLSAEQLGAHAFHFARKLFGHPTTAAAPRLTPREVQCIHLLAAGVTQRESGVIMGISSETVFQYLKHARALYGVSNKTQLLACALRDGIITYEEAIPRHID